MNNSKGCVHLRSIDISWCKHISSEALCAFVSSCNQLRYFSSKGLKNVAYFQFKHQFNINLNHN